MRFRLASAALLLATSATAQSAPRASVRGVVYDSVARAPLEGAVVQAVQVDSARGGSRVFTTRTDAQGRYQLDTLPAGKFGIGFQHRALEALSLESPLHAFQLSSDTSRVVVDMAVPAGSQVRAASCPGSGDKDGLLAGFVLDAARGGSIPGATVNISWVEIGVVDGKLRTIPRQLTAKVDDDGTYLACGIAGETAVGIEIMAAGHRGLVGEITIPEGSTLRRDFRLADSSSTGVGVVRGRVLREDGSGVPSGRVGIPALGVDAAVENGAFSIEGVPPGTWLIEARVIGWTPQAAFVDVAAEAPANVSFAVTEKVQMLDAINVVGKPSGDLKILNEVLERGRTSFGTMFMPGNSWLESAMYPADVVRAARGFTYLGLDKVRARGCTMLGTTNKHLVVYLDGGLFPGGLEELTSMVPVKQILAIEAYPDVISMPARWRSYDACAAIVVWTKR
jgi:hypothetical protein